MSTAFPDTHWSRLAELGQRSEAERAETLRWFARQYWQPVHDYVRALRRDARDADDLTQQFFTTLLARESLDALSPQRGSVRGFLKTSLRNFLSNTDRAARARPMLVPLEGRDPADEQAADAEEAFDRAWVQRVLEQAIAHLRSQLEREGRAAQFQMFDAYCLHDGQTPSYEELAQRHGLKSEDVRNRVRDARRRMIAIVRGVVAEYLGPGQNVEDEVAFIVKR